MRPTIRPRALAALVLGGLLLAACSAEAGDVSELRDDLENQAQAQAALRERIGELESLLDSSEQSGASATQTLSGLEEQLQALTDELSQVRLDLETRQTATEDAAAEVGASITSLDARILELENRIASLETLIAQVRNDLLSLADDHELLRAEFDRHKRDHTE
ncbi:MAG TPA: hypothetical protein VGA69_11175 [Nitriliruptorales bacterium]